MPAATRYWSDNPNDSADRALREAAESERRDRHALYAASCAQYDGLHKKFLKVRNGVVDPNVIINRDGQAIDARLNFFFPEMWTLQLDDLSEESPDEQLILDIFEDNGGASLLQDCGLYGELTGHVYVRVYGAKFSQVSETEYQLDPDADVRIVALNPAYMLTYWSAEDKDTELWHEYCYTSDRKYKVDFINLAAFGGTGWMIKKYTLRNNTWEQVSEEAWPLAHGPIIAWQHLRDPRGYYGKPALGESKLNDSLNKVASDIKQILRYHAAPRTIGKGVEPAQIVATGIDNFLTVPGDTNDTKTDVFNLEMQSDLTSSMNFLNYLDNAHSAGMKIARITGADALKNITNLGLKVAFADLLAESNRVHRNYTAGMTELILTVLEILGRDTESVHPQITWPMALPMSELEATQTVQMQIDMGILSKESAATELGIDWQKEQERLDSEGADAQAIADAVGQAMGQMQAQQGQQPPPNGNGNMPMNGKDMNA